MGLEGLESIRALLHVLQSLDTPSQDTRTPITGLFISSKDWAPRLEYIRSLETFRWSTQLRPFEFNIKVQTRAVPPVIVCHIQMFLLKEQSIKDWSGFCYNIWGIVLSARRKHIHWAGRFGVCNFGVNPSQHRQSHGCPMQFKKPNLEVEYLRAQRQWTGASFHSRLKMYIICV